METKEFVDETNEKDKVIADIAKKYPENKDIQIFAHGDTKGIDVFIDGGTERIENANTLIKLINKYFETGKTLQIIVMLLLYYILAIRVEGIIHLQKIFQKKCRMQL